MRKPLVSPQTPLLVASLILVLGTLSYALRPMLASHPASYLGVHDWDQVESYRYLLRKSLILYHQFPFWNPYGCGGHDAWGGIESDGGLVSPLLPVYLFAPVALAARIEVVVVTLWALGGASLLASRFTRSHVLCALVAIAWGLNGRWALQTTCGRGWHLEYAWLPWVLYYFDRAIDRSLPEGAGRTRDIALTGVCLAMMAYMGAIYPLPHAGVALGIYAACTAIGLRSTRPLIVLALVGALGFAFAAPKLVPILHELGRFPRIVESKEVLDIRSFIQLLTDPEHQDDPWWKQGTVSGQWHEWGMYLGWPMVLVLVVGCAFAWGVRERAMIWIGAVLTLLAFGAIDPYMPWAILHKLPIFRSQHVPSRWLYPALLPFACATASTGERLLRRFAWKGRRRLLVEAMLAVVLGVLAFRMERVARQPLAHTFAVPPPALSESTGPFVMYQHLPPAVDYEPTAWVPATLPAEIGNFGITDCGTAHGLVNPGERTANRRAFGLGARGVGDPEYHGEVYVAEGSGSAQIVRWTPNAVTVRVQGATPGEHLVLNQNWDAGWAADAGQVVNRDDAIAIVLRGGDQTISLRYRSPGTWLGVAMAALAAFAIALVGWAQRRNARPNRRAPSLAL